MENQDGKIAVVTIVVKDENSVESVNRLLHNYKDYIIGRFGLPVKHKNINVISVVIDADSSIVNSLSGKLGMITGITSKVLTTK